MFYADATFTNLSTEAVSLVEKGAVSVSALLFQRQDDPSSSGSDREKWGLVATSRPEKLSMVCHLQQTDRTKLNWVCKTPRITDILFGMPGSAIISGHDLRLNILFATEVATDIQKDDSRRSYVYMNDQLYEKLESVNLSSVDAESIVVDIVQASVFTIIHTNPIATGVDIGGRLLALLVTLVFSAFWLLKLGLRGLTFGFCDSCRKKDALFEIRRGKFPYTLFRG